MEQTPNKIKKTIRASTPKSRNWFITKMIKRNKPKQQIAISKITLKMLNKYDFFSSVVFCFNTFINFFEIKKTANKIETIKITTEYTLGEFTAKYHKGKTTANPKTAQINASKRNLPNEIKNDKKPLITEFCIVNKNSSPKTINHF